MGLIRSLIVRLGMDSANFDAGTKKASHSLYGLTSSMARTQQMFSSFGKIAIAARISSATAEGFTAWLKVAGEGGTKLEILKEGLYGFAQGIPIVGRMVGAFKELKDEITGTRIQQELLKASMEFKERKVEIETRMKAPLESNADKRYRETIKAINAASPMIAKEGLGPSSAVANMMAIKTGKDVNALIREAMAVRTSERFDEEIERAIKLEDEKLELGKRRLAALEKINKNYDDLQIARQRARENHAEYIKNFASRYDTDRMRIEKEYQELLKNRSEIGEEAFKRGENALKRDLLNAEYTRMANPQAMEIDPSRVNIRAFSETGKEILVKRQENLVTKEEQNLIKWDTLIKNISQVAGIN